MTRKLLYKYCCLLIVLCLGFGGCGNMPTEQEQKDFRSNSVKSHETTGSAPDTIMASEPGAGQEPGILTEDSFLEEGSGFARRSLSDAELLWYRDMERILGSYGTDEELSEEALEEGLDEKDIDRIFQCVLNDHPELFYVDGYSYVKYTQYGQENDILSVEFSGRYSMDREEAKRRQGQIQEAVEMILAGIDEDAGQYEKVKYVYDTLIRETDYRLDSEDNQNIYSVFVNHLSVCQGYAKATQYLLNRMGVECALVLGTVETGEGHAWNLVNVDGSYYYLDTTWGDASYQLDEDGTGTRHTMPEINYDYLNVTTEELLRTHTLDRKQHMPLCTDTAANYYVREGALFDSYDREQMASLFERALVQERTDVTVKCATRECYDDIFHALVEEKEIFGYLPDDGQRIAYTQNDVQLSMTFWVTKE